jgi:PrtD family type I secretion system ABC transporter
MAHVDDQADGSAVRKAVLACWAGFLSVALLSATVNVLMLTGSFFMLEVYDRVLPSRNIPTLVGLSLIAAVLFLFQAGIDMIRSRIMVRIGTFLDGALGERVYRAALKLRVSGQTTVSQPSRDLDQVRAFFQSGGPVAFCDLPWIPLYSGLCFLFHPWIGFAVFVGALVLVVPTTLTEIFTRYSSKRLTQLSTRRHILAEASTRHAEVLLATGMQRTLSDRWRDLNHDLVREQQRTSDVSGGFGAVSKSLRMMLQSSVLALGAYLVIQGEATAGIIIASSILSARALAPVEMTIQHWKGFVSARQSLTRLRETLDTFPEKTKYTVLPAPSQTLALEHLTIVSPGTARYVVRDVSFELKAGQGLGIIGPSGSGKSSLIRCLAGVWKPAGGRVKIDGAALDQWSPDARGRYLGYLPQDVELFAGTVAENITRFEKDRDDGALIAASRAASVHDLILNLPEGYETDIGENGSALSAGQRQRIALARALYRDPFIVILDEPNSNLDQEGDLALTRAIAGVRERGGIVIVVAHRPSALAAVDTALLMIGGTMKVFGPKDEILNRITPIPTPHHQPRAVEGETP